MRTAWLVIAIAACSSTETTKSPTTPKPPGAPGPTVVPPDPVPAGPQPPVAARRPHELTSAHGTRNDPYYWLRDDKRADKDVLAYLNAENEYTKAVLAPAIATADKLFSEMRARIKEDDSSVPKLDDGYWYYTRFEIGQQYPVIARKKGTLDAAEQIVLDGNALAKGHPFYRIGDYAVTRDGRLVAWTEDTVGRNQYTLRIKDLSTDKNLPDTAEKVSAAVEWANDGKTLFLTGKDAVTLREDRVFRLELGKQPEQIFEEKDAQYYVGIGHTKSRKYIEIVVGATTNSEVRLIDADRPKAPIRVLLPRSKDHLYNADHLDGRFVIRTNDKAKNFRVVEVADGKEGKLENWKDVVPHRADVLVEDVVVYRSFMAVTIRDKGLRKISVMPKGAAAFLVDAQDPTYVMSAIDTPDPADKKLRYSYDSMTSPSTTYELDLGTKARKVLKQQPVPTYDAEQYTSEYLHATATDGTQIPISLVRKKTTKVDGSAPLWVYGYGSYGASMEPWLSLGMISLLDRGFVYAIAHVRGGQEMGRAWYEDGKLMKKMNTFTDFIAATEHLVKQGYGARDRVYASGGSAGGLLMGAIANLRPDLYRGIVTAVPFVDVVTTMQDASIPLTTNEYDEWGNPSADKAAYDYMLSYSPYDNIKPVAYPAIFCKTGLHDSQVQYFEPAKWVAKLRATTKGDAPIVLDIDMTSGHGGASGRFDRLRDTARQYAFILMVDEKRKR